MTCLVVNNQINLLLFEFCKGSNASVFTKNICYNLPNALVVLKCQRWFSEYKFGNFYLSNLYRSGRPMMSDNGVIRAEEGAYSCQTIKELSTSINQP